jgi:outer membrane receptor protein involved in Fe transport
MLLGFTPTRNVAAPNASRANHEPDYRECTSAFIDAPREGPLSITYCLRERGCHPLLTYRAFSLTSYLLGALFSHSVIAETAQDVPVPKHLQEVVVMAPLITNGTPLQEIAGNVQTISTDELSSVTSATDALNRLGRSVSINDTQGSPFQPDVSFRGFTASPILGTPQGVSIFVDGVRVNETFADAVNWDLIPLKAIARLEIIPGSNPVFGLNTLGGAIAATTKRGFDFSQTDLEMYGGSFKRRAADVESGGHGERWDYYVAGNLFDEDGWGDHNPSRLHQGFGKLGYRDARNDAQLSFTYGDNRMEGNQTLPRSFLNAPSQAYTWPDAQSNRMSFVDFNLQHKLSTDWMAAANAYYRSVNTDVINSNVNDDYDPTTDIGPGNQPTSNVIEASRQHRSGATIQLTDSEVLGGDRNTLVLGASYDRGVTDFRQLNQEAGAARDTRSSAAQLLTTLLWARTRYSGIYFTDTLALADKTYLNVAGRYNSAQVSIADRIGTALNGAHSFDRFNPSIGMTYSPTRAFTVYGSYNEGMRVPTPVELTCADPQAPCNLPNAFASDPPLKAVLAKTMEGGVRGALAPNIDFSAALFRTNLDNDIQFVSSGGGAVSAGFFRNVGHTRRQGVELDMQAKVSALVLSVRYTYLEATFRSPLILNSPNNSSAAGLSCLECTEIQVKPGDRIPGIPQHNLKLSAEQAFGALAIGLDVRAQSRQFARGDENNSDSNGPISGYVVADLDAHYELSSNWRVFARVDNLFDRRYFTFATLGQNVFTAPGNAFDATAATWRSEQFRTVSAPRGIWLGVDFRIGAPGTS